MKTRFVDPFSPNRPIDDPLRFTGRREQVEEVVDSLYQVAHGNPKHTIITGDRGIGKSSLLLQTRFLAQGDNRLSERLSIYLGLEKHTFATAWHDCDKGQGVRDLVRGLSRDIEGKLTKIIGKIDFKMNIFDVLEVGRNIQQSEIISDLVAAFVSDATNAFSRLQAKGHAGLIFFIDEIDRADASSGIASFFKLATERLSREGQHRIAFFAAGITGAIQNLEEEHASIVRTFRDVPIPRWTKPESDELLKIGFDSVGVSYDPGLFTRIFQLSAGFPEPIHLLGSEILSVDEDNHLDMDDLEKARIKLVTDVRRNKLERLLKSAGSGKYQSILRAMANYNGPNVPLSHISAEIGYEQNQYSTNMATLVERGILSRMDKGIYCFVDPLLKEYIREFGIISVDPDATE